MMKRITRGLFFGLFLAVAGTAAAAETSTRLDLGVDAGYREDEIDWNIAGSLQGTGPNVISELEWDDLEIYQVRARGKLVVGRNDFPWFATCIKGAAAYGWIVDGTVRDSDYAGDNRTLEFSRAVAENDGDEVYDLSLAIGPQFRLARGALLLTPLFGYSRHEQHLRMTDGNQVLSDQANADVLFGPGVVIVPPTGPFAGLDSTFETKWSGPWTGLDVEWRPLPRLALSASGEYHWGDYEGRGNWNLRTDLANKKSFDQDADAEGVVLSATASLDLGAGWSATLSYDWQDWESDEGVIWFNLAGGGAVPQQLNEANWTSQAVMLGVEYRFL
jgi:hypothetical protein